MKIKGHGVAIYQTKWFDRWAQKQGLSAAALCEAVQEMGEGLFDADLGGGLLKKRIARPGEGKRGGFRTLVATNKGGRWIFVFGFPKNERSNIDKDEQEALKKLSTYLLSLTLPALAKAQSDGELLEVNCNAQD
ncbi:MAG: type II toxin-antitoxin system RelE/ParE family toxin [Burkholderiaceae bacterium]